MEVVATSAFALYFFRQASSVKLFDEPSALSTVPVFGDTDPYERQIESFAASVLNDTPTSPGLEDGIAALRIVDAVHAAVARSGVDFQSSRLCSQR